MQLPIGQEAEFNGIIDLIEMNAIYHDDLNEKVEVVEIPEEYMAKAKEYRQQLIEKVAETDDNLMERFF